MLQRSDRRSRRSARSRSIARAVLSTVLAATLVLVGAGLSKAEGGFNASNTGIGSLSSGMLGLSSTVGGATCSDYGSSSASVNCTGSLLPAAAASSATQAATVTNVGTVSAVISAAVNPASIGVAQGVNTGSASSDPVIAFGGTSFGSSGPLGGLAVGLSGGNAQLISLQAQTPTAGWTVMGWFESGPGGGVVFSQGSTQFTGGSWGEIMAWVSSSGAFTAYTESTTANGSVSDSSGVFNNNTWHFFTMVYNASGKKTLSLYMDGSLVQTVADKGKPGTSGGISLGYTDANITFNTPTSQYLTGALAGIAVVPSQLTAAQISALYSSASFSAYSSGVLSYSPTDYWALQDSGTVPYTGVLPGVSGSIGNYLDTTVGLTLNGTSSCLYPISSSACPAPGSSDTLSGLASGPVGTANLATGSSATVTVSVSQDSSTPSTVYLVDVLAGVKETGANGPWSVSLRYESDTQL